MKKLIAVSAGIAVLAGSAVALGAQPNPSVIYAGKGGISIYPGPRGSHTLWETLQVKSSSNSAAPCSSKYDWEIGYQGGGKTFRSNTPIKIGRSGRWSATRPNQLKQVKHKAKIRVTGVFTSKTAGHGTWQVVGCATKHSFKITQAAL